VHVLVHDRRTESRPRIGIPIAGVACCSEASFDLITRSNDGSNDTSRSIRIGERPFVDVHVHVHPVCQRD